MVPPVSRRVSRAPRYSGCRLARAVLARTGLSPAMAGLSRPFRFVTLAVCRSHNPAGASTPAVWAPPLSLAATRGITCLFSPPAATKMFQFTAFAHLSVSHRCGVPPFGHPRVKGCLRLAGEFRRLSRPSSPLGAWASSVRPCLLLLGGRALARAPGLSLQNVNVRSAPVRGVVEVALSVTLALVVGRLPSRGPLGPPERRCSSRTFRYGYLVTT